MLYSRLLVAVVCMCFAGLSALRAEADPVADLAKSSVFQGVDLSALSGGKILSARGPSLDFPRDLSVQAVYLLHAPLARTLDLHKQWDAQRHPELKVYLHRDFSSHPAIADFNLALPQNGAVRKLADATAKLPNTGDLQLSKAEAAAFKNSGGSGFTPAMRDFWAQVLLHRATAFIQHGLSGQPAYDAADGSVRVADEVSRLLREQPKVRAAFQPVISQSPLAGASGAGASSYWELFDEEGQAAFTLGAESSVQPAGGAQLVDLQYYGSGGYYAYITLYQMWPVTVDGKQATLVWRVDSLSSLSLSDLRPVEKMGSGSAMLKNVQRMISLFQKDSGR